MKRARSLSVDAKAEAKDEEFQALERAYKAAKTDADALGDKLWQHPVSVARRAQEARAELAAKVPAALHDAWITRAGLTVLDMIGYAEDDGEFAHRMWQFKARFEPPAAPVDRKGRKVLHNGKVERYEVTLTYDSFMQEWSWDDGDLYPVDFDADAGRMWAAALRANDNDVGAAMAAFCHACGEHMNNMSAPPSKVKEFASGV